MAGQPRPSDSLPEFVGSDDCGQPWLDAAYEKIAPLIDQSDFDRSSRVPPGAITGCSRTGKTRSLMELGKKLREDDKNVIFLSFNEKTSYADGEAPSLLDSLLVRIAYAIAKDDAISGMSLHDYTTEPPTLRFTTQKKSVLDWLDENDCVLLMDELNKCIKPDVDGAVGVVRFLRDHFVENKGRYYVFTTHVSSTSRVVEMLGNTTEAGSSERYVEGLGTVLVTTESQWKVLTRESAYHPAWYGLSAGLMYEDTQSATLPAKWKTAYQELERISTEAALPMYDSVLLDLFAPELTSSSIVPQVEQLSRVLTIKTHKNRPPLRRRSWAPMALHYVLAPLIQPAAGIVVKLLERLKTTKIGAGEACELV